MNQKIGPLPRPTVAAAKNDKSEAEVGVKGILVGKRKTITEESEEPVSLKQSNGRRALNSTRNH
jgi:hypothetical protein